MISFTSLAVLVPLKLNTAFAELALSCKLKELKFKVVPTTVLSKLSVIVPVFISKLN